jgi:hypothetical protein
MNGAAVVSQTPWMKKLSGQEHLRYALDSALQPPLLILLRFLPVILLRYERATCIEGYSRRKITVGAPAPGVFELDAAVFEH